MFAIPLRPKGFRRYQAAAVALAVAAGLLVAQTTHATTAQATVANCDGGTISSRQSAFAFVANHIGEFVGLGDALNTLRTCGYGDVDGLSTSLAADNDASLQAAGLLPAAQTDINGMTVGPVFGDSTNTPQSLIRESMWYLDQKYESATNLTAPQQNMLDLMRAQAHESGDWKLDLYDYTWRYRLWQWIGNQSWYARLVGPYTGTTVAAAPAAPVPPLQAGVTATTPPFVAPSGAYNAGAATGFTTGFQGNDPGAAHFAVWGRQLGQDVGQIGGVMTALGTKSELPDTLLVELGFNDIGWLGAGAGLTTTMKQFIDNARKANPNVSIVLANVPQRTSLGSANPLLGQRTRDYNAALAAAIPGWSTAQSPFALADFDSDYGCNPNLTVCDSTYDGLHPSPIGEYRIAHAFETALHGSFGIGTSVPPVPATADARPLATPGQPVFNGNLGGITVTWPKVFGAHGYDVQWRDVTSDPHAAWSDATTSTNRWDKAWQFDLQPADGHAYQVHVRSSGGDAAAYKSAWPATVQGVAHPTTAGPPSNVVTHATATGVDAKWTAPTGANTGSIVNTACGPTTPTRRWCTRSSRASREPAGTSTG